MESHGKQTPYVKPETAEKLHVCLDCGSGLVYPMEWEEAGPQSWNVVLHCPNCNTYRTGEFGQASVEAFDEELDRGCDDLLRGYERLVRANMSEEIERFVGALHAGAILPEDFEP